MSRVSASVGVASRRRSKLTRRNHLIAYSFIAPNFIGFFCLTFLPVLFSLVLAFLRWDSANPMEFAGISNFTKMASDSTFRISFFNTLYFTVGTVPLTLIGALGLALILNQPIKGRTFFRSVFFFPYIASLVAIAVVWNMIFHPDMGPVNSLLRAIGVANPPRWSASVDWAMPTVIGLSIWKGVGYYMVVYLAALQGIPRELSEAAIIDGANSWQLFRHVTLPLLTPTTFFVLLMLVINAFKIFDLIYIMTSGGPGRSTNVLVYHIYNTAFIRFEFGYASAMAVVLFAFVLILTLRSSGLRRSSSATCRGRQTWNRLLVASAVSGRSSSTPSSTPSSSLAR